MRSESRCAKQRNSTNLDFVEQIQQGVEDGLREILDLYIDSSSDEEPSNNSGYFTNVGYIFEQDRMLYPYSKYNDEVDEEAHICTFLAT